VRRRHRARTHAPYTRTRRTRIEREFMFRELFCLPMASALPDVKSGDFGMFPVLWAALGQASAWPCEDATLRFGRCPI